MNKRFLSLIVILALIVTAIPFTAGIASDAAPISEISLADFGSGGINGAFVMDKGYPTNESVCTRASIDTSVCFTGSQSSLVWQFGNHNGVLIKIPYNNSLWTSGCDKFNIRFYSAIPEQSITILVNEYDTFRSSADNNYWSGSLVTGNGWQEMSIDVSQIKNSWSVNSPDFVYVLLISGWGKTVGTKADFDAGRVNAITGEKMYIDEIRLTNSKYGSPMNPPVPSVENNSGFVSSDLGNSNTFTLTYEKNIYVLDGAAKLYKTENGFDYSLSDIGYTVEKNQNKLNIIFDASLPDNNYKLVIDSNKVMSLDGEMVPKDLEFFFSVGRESVFFNIVDISFEDGDVFDNLPEEITITFSTAPDRSLYIPDYITLYCNGEKLYDAFNYTLDEKVVKLFPSKLLGAGAYSLRISEEYSNIYGNTVMGNNEYNFEVNSADSSDADETIMVFYSDNADEMANVISNSNSAVSEFSTITNLCSKNAKLCCESNSISKFVKTGSVNLAGMEYMNYWVYNGGSSGDKIEFRLYTNYSEDVFAKYPYELSWDGWKLVSIPLADFKGDIIYDAIGIVIDRKNTRETSQSFVLVDAIWATAELPGDISLVSKNLPDEYVSASVNGEVLELTYSEQINQSILPIISVTDNLGNVFSDFNVKVSDNVICVEFGRFEPEMIYQISVNRVASLQMTTAPKLNMTITTSNDGFCLENITFSDASSQNESVDVTFYLSNEGNNDYEITLCTVLAAISDKSNAMIKRTITVPAHTSSHTETIELVSSSDATKIVAYALMSSGKMISQKYYTKDASGTTYTSVVFDEKNKVSINSAAININVLSVEIKTERVRDTVIITIMNKDGDIVFADVVTTEQHKSKKYFELSENAIGGKYTVNAICGAKSDTKDLYYVSSSDRDRLVYYANSGNGVEIEKLLLANAEVFSLENSSTYLIRELSTLISDKGGFDVYADIYSFILHTSASLNIANKAVWSDVTNVISKNSYLFGGENDDEYKYFLSLDENEKNKISIEICKKMPVELISQLNTVFENAVVYHKTNSNNVTIRPSGNRGSSSSVSGLPYNSIQPHTPVEIISEFTDLSDVPWAVDAILSLRKRGVISASTDKLFRPNDNITREEFIKLIVCALSPDATESVNFFVDAPESAWYTSYVQKARNLGVLNGYPDGTFGVGEYITREDMVTMIARFFNVLGKEITAKNAPDFIDANEISDYAYNHVAVLAEHNIINGIGDGRFAPKMNATRAQAAKIVAALSSVN